MSPPSPNALPSGWTIKYGVWRKRVGRLEAEVTGPPKFKTRFQWQVVRLIHSDYWGDHYGTVLDTGEYATLERAVRAADVSLARETVKREAEAGPPIPENLSIKHYEYLGKGVCAQRDQDDDDRHALSLNHVTCRVCRKAARDYRRMRQRHVPDMGPPMPEDITPAGLDRLLTEGVMASFTVRIMRWPGNVFNVQQVIHGKQVTAESEALPLTALNSDQDIYNRLFNQVKRQLGGAVAREGMAQPPPPG